MWRKIFERCFDVGLKHFQGNARRNFRMERFRMDGLRARDIHVPHIRIQCTLTPILHLGT